MHSINIQISDSLMYALRLDEKAAPEEIKKILAVQYFKNRRLSLGKGAELAGMSKDAFVELLSENEVDIFKYATKEFDDELEQITGFIEEYKNERSN